jgi:1-acyl-sn-glycerol-3-phosphate acyltransferase
MDKKHQLSREWVNKKILKWAHQVIGYTKAKWQVINPHHVAPIHGQPTIIMCNHASLYDIPFTYLAFPNETIRMLAKKELKKIPFFGKTIELGGHLFIDRHNRQQAINNLNNMRKFLADDIVMWIAPEGTRSADGKLANFKKGGFITAIQAQATIIPIVIRGANSILPARSLNFSLHQKVDIIIGQPVDASEYTLEQKDELINLVHNSMQSMLDEKSS